MKILIWILAFIMFFTFPQGDIPHDRDGEQQQISYSVLQEQMATRHEEEQHPKTYYVNRGDYKRPKLLGTFDLTAYTAGPESTGKRPGDKGYGITYYGYQVEEGVTIAADKRVLPKGTKVYIEGLGIRTVQDTGSAIKGKRIDVYFDDLDKALAFGRQHDKQVYILEMGRDD